MLPRALKPILALVSVACTAALNYLRLGELPTGPVWAHVPSLAVTYLFAFGALEVADRGYAAWKAAREARFETARREGEQILKGALRVVVRVAKQEWTSVGLHLFLVDTRWRWSWPPRQEYLRHVVRLKMSEHPPPTGITWTKGKGVVGLCWQTGAFTEKDLPRHYWKYRGASRAEWDRLPDEVRMGLSYEDFQRSKDMGPVLAAPVLDGMGTVYLGCVSLDGPKDCNFAELSSPEVREALQAAASFIAPRVRKKSVD